MNYCSKCGTKLIQKQDGIDGLVPYCPSCNEYRYEQFNSAISSIVFNKNKDKVLLIQQYNRNDNILIAGYITKGENAKETLVREIQEEVGLKVLSYKYNDNEYFEKTNTLIHNYMVVVDSENYQLTDEVDKATWFTKEEALENIKPNSLAKHFLEECFNKIA
ncbi:MAG: NUDIX domain-containing protein [Thomasclavelia sp.]|nr:NUDIX domain-containing protein [Thomasclavelia sp.]